ncbi:SagB/ThcOx family dehydrogenase [Bacteroidales bacterium OttesenSCG-928-E04]|nr:SagB/ThcOx family dehydrogenase [Bacteroidales bacterium OttesenSCG-928-E04]MDL2326555.1 SagB/ThcOx family dehydrogenase [Bacteroidales bacterium OttesenSCG-928-A14]
MKKILTTISILLVVFTINAQDIKLPAPNKKGGKPLMEALAERKSNREFADKALSEQQLSDLLWAANGISREDGRKTAPSARNMQQIEIYIFLEKGTYLYDAKENKLTMMKGGDNRKEVTSQSFAQTAPALLVFVANYDKMGNMDDEARNMYGATDCGNVSQNVYLYCSSTGLNTVAIGYINREAIQKLLGYNGKAILGQVVGFPK